MRNTPLCLIAMIPIVLCMAACRQEPFETAQDSEKGLIKDILLSVFDSSPDKEINTDTDVITMSVYASGGIKADNVKLIWSQGQWSGQEGLQWDNSQQNATMYAYSPFFDPAAQQFYASDGTLTDLLAATQTREHGQSFYLNFHHHFSKLTLNINQKVHKQLASLEVTPSVSVKSLEIPKGTVTFSRETHTATLPAQTDSTYSLIIPPATDMKIDLTLHMKDGNIRTATIEPGDYEEGKNYTFRLTEKEETIQVGIRTAEDFIAFTHLMNGEEYEGRTLSEFGEEKDGKTTYYLLEDITFDAELSNRVQTIGYRTSAGEGVKDIIDGGGHTLYNLTLKEKTDHGNTAQGLFCYVEKGGRIKNLTLDHCSISCNAGKSKAAGILAGSSSGIINGCTVKNCFVQTSLENCKVGTLAGSLNNGSVINCLSIDNAFDCPNAWVGGILGYNNGSLKNCLMAGCDFTKAGMAGGLCKHLESGSGIIENCYSYNGKYDANNQEHSILLQTSYSDRMKYCYYVASDGITVLPDKYTFYDIAEFDPNSLQLEDGSTLTDNLNQWVDENQNASQSIQYLHWMSGSYPPVILKHP